MITGWIIAAALIAGELDGAQPSTLDSRGAYELLRKSAPVIATVMPGRGGIENIAFTTHYDLVKELLKTWDIQEIVRRLSPGLWVAVSGRRVNSGVKRIVDGQLVQTPGDEDRMDRAPTSVEYLFFPVGLPLPVDLRKVGGSVELYAQLYPRRKVVTAISGDEIERAVSDSLKVSPAGSAWVKLEDLVKRVKGYRSGETLTIHLSPTRRSIGTPLDHSEKSLVFSSGGVAEAFIDLPTGPGQIEITQFEPDSINPNARVAFVVEGAELQLTELPPDVPLNLSALLSAFPTDTWISWYSLFTSETSGLNRIWLGDITVEEILTRQNQKREENQNRLRRGEPSVDLRPTPRNIIHYLAYGDLNDLRACARFLRELPPPNMKELRLD